MNEKNLSYLKENLKYLGFGDQLYPALEKNIQQRFPEFVIKLDTELNKRPFSSTLYFKRGEHTDLYFFNRWDATLRNEAGKKEQSFYLNKGQGITFKEGFNLLEGRAVHKELSNQQGQKYTAWLQLDFSGKDERGNYKMKQFHQNYGFDLEKTLTQYPIKELGNEQQKAFLLRSLQKGNVAGVTLEKETGPQKFFLEANPQYKSVTFFNERMALVKSEALTALKTPPPATQIKQEMKAVPKETLTPTDNSPSQKRSTKQVKAKSSTLKQNGEPGMLKKKRVQHKKGLSMN